MGATASYSSAPTSTSPGVATTRHPTLATSSTTFAVPTRFRDDAHETAFPHRSIAPSGRRSRTRRTRRLSRHVRTVCVL